MSMNILQKYIDHDIYEIVNIGFSDLDQHILEYFKEKNVSFVIPTQMIPLTRDHKHQFIYLDITKEIPVVHKGKYDLIIFTEVLEHLLAPDELVIYNLHSLLRIGGLILLSVPNIATFANRFRLLVGRNVCWSKKDQINGVYGGYGHIREYTLKEANEIIKPFQILEVSGISGYRMGIKRLFNILPTSFQNTIVVVGKKIVDDEKAKN